MESLGREHDDARIDVLLRGARPTPDPKWVARTEADLFAPRRSWLPSWRPAPALRLGTAFALGLVDDVRSSATGLVTA